MERENPNKTAGVDRIRAWMMIEVLAINEETAKTSLRDLIDKMKNEKGTELVKQDFKEIQKIENPMKNVKEAFSQVVEIEILAKSYETLVNIVINYGPSAVEILEPSSLNINVGEAQAILTQIADLIHRFASAGVGGLIITEK